MNEEKTLGHVLITLENMIKLNPGMSQRIIKAAIFIGIIGSAELTQKVNAKIVLELLELFNLVSEAEQNERAYR